MYFLLAQRYKGKIYLVYYLIGLPELKTTGGKANKINMQRSSTLGTYNFLANGFTLRMKQHKTIPISFFFLQIDEALKKEWTHGSRWEESRQVDIQSRGNPNLICLTFHKLIWIHWYVF